MAHHAALPRGCAHDSSKQNKSRSRRFAQRVPFARAQGAPHRRQDADDVSDSDRIERTMDFLLLVRRALRRVRRRVSTIPAYGARGSFRRRSRKHIIAQKNPFFHPTMLFRRAVLESVNATAPLPKPRRTEDYDLVMRLAANGVIGETGRSFTRCTNRRKLSPSMPGPHV